MNNNSSNNNSEFEIFQVNRLQNLIREITHCCDDRKLAEAKKFSIPYAEIKCLMLFTGERYLTVKNIAQELDVAKSRVTKIIGGLKGKGLVSSNEDPNDVRIKLISLTSKGRKILEEINFYNRGLHAKILEHLSTEERKNVLSCLELLRSAMEAVKGELNL